MQRTRHLKIVKSFSTDPKAFLPLKGRWLERAGFRIGMRVAVIVRAQCLVILPEAGSGSNRKTDTGSDDEAAHSE